MLSRLRFVTKTFAPRQLYALTKVYRNYADTVNLTFINRDGSETPVKAKVGENILTVAKAHNIDLEGACEGTLACSTCHVYIDEAYLSKMPEKQMEEEDMLEQAQSPVQENSRLGCQIELTKEMDGMKITLPPLE